MIEINSQSGDYFTFDQETENISMNGIIVPFNEYQPVYTRNGAMDGDVPPSFIGIWDLAKNSIITISGRIHKLTSSDNEIDI